MSGNCWRNRYGFSLW